LRTGRFIFALLLILAGVTALMVNLGYGSWDMASQIGKFWPALLIIIGLGIFWGRQIPHWLAIILTAVIVVAVIALFSWAPAQPKSERQQSVTVSRQSYSGVNSAQLNLDLGGGKLTVGTGTDQWLTGSCTSTRMADQVTKEGDRLSITLSNPDHLVWGPDLGNIGWDLQLSPDLFWDLKLNTGAIDGHLDLTNLMLQNLDIKTGAGNLTIKLGNRTDTRIKVNAGASNLQFQVPEDVGVKAHITSALANSNIDGVNQQGNTEYTSPNYEKAKTHLDLTVSMGASSLNLNRYVAKGKTNTI
jgi:predicted membrane protein